MTKYWPAVAAPAPLWQSGRCARSSEEAHCRGRQEPARPHYPRRTGTETEPVSKKSVSSPAVMWHFLTLTLAETHAGYQRRSFTSRVPCALIPDRANSARPSCGILWLCSAFMSVPHNREKLGKRIPYAARTARRKLRCH